MKIRRIIPLLCCLALVLAALPTPALAGKRSIPKLLVTGFSLETGTLEAGGQSLLTVTIQNTSTFQDALYLKLSLETGDTRLLFPETASRYLEALPKGETAEITFLVQAAADAAPGYGSLTLSGEFEDTYGMTGTFRDSLSLEITQPMRLAHNQPVFPTLVQEGDTAAFSMDVQNLGKGALYNVTLNFRLPGLDSAGSLLVGSLAPGAAATAKANFTVSSMDGTYGESRGEITLTAEDAAGTLYTQVLPLSTEITQKPVVAAPEDTTATQEEGLPGWVIPTAVCAGIGLLLLVLQLLIERRRRKKDEQLL